MHLTWHIGVCLFVFVAASAAFADPVVTPAPTHAEALSGQKVTCKREKVTGSRLTKKVCTTKAQRDRAREQSREALEDVQRRTPPHQ